MIVEAVPRKLFAEMYWYELLSSFWCGELAVKSGEALLVQSVFRVINVSEKPVTCWELEKCEAALMTLLLT